jgi:type I restriction enzyme S subunit
MEDWKTYKLGEVVKILDYRRIPLSSKERSSRKGCYPYYGAQGIIDYIDDYLFDGTYLLIAEDGENLKSQKQNIAQLATGKYWVNNHAHIVESNGICDIRYLCYMLNTMDLTGYITGSAQPKLNQANLVAITLQLPPKEVQKRIADFLEVFDKRIENNKLINDNSEQHAQALFKSWFVDFEPFKDGEFVESELGMIPKGWRVGTLGELCNFKRGKNLLTKDAIPGEVPVVAGGLEPSCYHNVANTMAPVITVSGSGANAGFMRMYYQEVWASDCSFIDSTCDSLFFVYCFLSANRRLLKHAQTGAVQPHVKPANIHGFELVIPPKEVIDQFQRIVADTFIMKGNNEKETRRLATLRDTLLPRLMSGELKVNENNL